MQKKIRGQKEKFNLLSTNKVFV